MANLRFVPDYRVTINDEPIPAAMRASVSSVNYETGLEGSDRVEVTLANENLRWLDHDLFALDNSFTLALGYAPDHLERLFVGEVVGKSATFPAGGSPTVTVVAQDRLHRLQQGTKVRWFGIPLPMMNIPVPDPLVATIVTGEHGLIPIMDPVGAAIAVLLGGVEAAAAAGDPDAMQRVIRKQAAESDYDFLMKLAHENGWEMSIDHNGTRGGHKLRFFSPLDHLEPDITLRYGHSLLEFTPRLSTVGQIYSVTAYVWVSPIKTVFVVTVGWDWERASLTIEITPGAVPIGQKASDFLIEEPVTAGSAPRRIVSEIIPKLNKRLTGSGSTIGDPRIQAGTVLQCEGVGVEFGGLYRVTSAKHTFDSSGYRTSFEVRKDIWFGLIPSTEQGAVPVQAVRHS